MHHEQEIVAIVQNNNEDMGMHIRIWRMQEQDERVMWDRWTIFELHDSLSCVWHGALLINSDSAL